MKKFTFLVLLGLISIWGNAQVNICENFDGGLALPTGWTGVGYFGAVTQVCDGFSQRDNLDETSTTGNLTTYNAVGVSNGTNVNVSFDYKVVDWSAATDATPPGWGEILVNYSTDNGTNWLSAGVINDDNHVTSNVCATMEFTIPAASVPAGSDFKLQFVGNWTSGNFYIYFDNICATQTVEGLPTCSTLTTPTPGSTGVSINTDLEWTVANNVPSNYHLTFQIQDGDVILDTDTGLSTVYNLLPTLEYSTTYCVTITPSNANGDAEGCETYCFTTGADPNLPVDCSTGTPINVQYCYTNSDTTTWNFQSSDGSPLNVFFNAGGIEEGWDSIIIYDGADNTAPVLYSGDNGGDLTGLSINSTGDTIFIEIDSDTSGSCFSSSACCTAPWDFDVSCIDETALPNCNAVMTTPENGAVDVSENTDIIWSPASILVTGYTVYVGTTEGGSELGLFENVTGTSVDPGTLPYETTIYVTIIPYNDNGDADCSAGGGMFTFTTKADPNQILDCGAGDVVNTTHCYVNNENESVNAFYFASNDGSPLFLIFNAGQVENNWDELFVLDSDGTNLNAATPYGNNGDLTGLSFTSTGTTLTVYVESDGVVSCSSSGFTPWDFTVACVDTSALPNCDAVLTAPFDGETDVDEDADLFWSQATVFVEGYYLSIGTSGCGSTELVDNMDVGNVQTYEPGTLEYETTYYVTLVPYNTNGIADCGEGEDIICQSFTTKADPNQIVDCGAQQVINTTYCYNSNENESVNAFYFTSSDGSPLFLIFNSGEVENNWDELYIIDSDGTNLNAATPYGNGGDLTGMTFTSTGDSLTVYVESDGSVSCQSSTAIDSWDFDVTCVDTTALPFCNAVLTTPFDGELDVDEDVVFSWSQATVLVTGYYLSIGTTPNGTEILDSFDVGNVLTYDPGILDYSTTYYVTIVPYNDNGPATDAEEANCSEFSFTVKDDPNVIIDCDAAEIVNTVYCYGNNENEDVNAFYFSNEDGFPLVISFNAGEVENNWDELYIVDGDGTVLNADAPYGNNGDLTGYTYISNSSSITVYVVSDGVGSCQSSGYVSWDFDVWCLTCVPQTVGFEVVGDCDSDPDNPQFSVNVNITDMGDATTLTISDDQGSGEQTADGTGTVLMGPYEANAEVVITVVNADDANCVVDSDLLTFVCPPAPNECSIVYAGEDVTVSCDENEAELTAVHHYFGQDTNVYLINELENCPQPATSGGVPTSLDIDDRWSNVINIGFDFCFFGGVYNQILIGSNGVLSFELENADAFNGWNIDPGDTLPNNDNASLTQANIFGVAHDIDPSVCGDINYLLLGSAPYRQFVVNYSSVCHFSCNELTSSSQIILYESSNNIDINIFDKPICATWNDGNAVVGVQNIDDTVAFTPPGRNTGVWETTDESWRFAPGGDESFTFEWLDEENNVVGTTETITVTPEETTTYTAAVTYTLCTGGTSTVTNSVEVIVEGTGGDSSFTMTPTCDGGTAEITGETGGTFAFNPEPEDDAVIDPDTGTITGGTPGATYTVEYTTGGSCSSSTTQDVTVLPAEDASFTLTATCDGATAEVTGDPGGTFAFNPEPGDDAVIDPETGTITGGTAGATYTVEYTTSGDCSANSTQDVTVLPAEDASFTLTATCDGATAEVTGDAGGAFAFNPEPEDDAVIDPGTGTITGGTAGATYTVEYTTSGDCPASSTQDVTVLPAEDASFTMTPNCDGGTAEVTGDAGGTFAFNPEPGDGAVIDSETGTVTGATNGTTYTIEYTTSGDCPATSTQDMLVEDTEAPTAVCNAITVSLENGSYTLSEDDIAAIGAGSDDNCGLDSMVVSVDNFTCDNIGDNMVVLTVTDINGNESTCEATVTVEGIVPEITITETQLSDYCHLVILTAESDGGVSYQWSTDEAGQVIEVTENGVYSVEVTSTSGCTATAEYEVTSIPDGAPLSDYTILASYDVFLHGENMVETGGVGVMSNSGQIKLHQNSHIAGFGQATDFVLNQGSTIGEEIDEAAYVTLPSFIYNTVSNSDSEDVEVAAGQTMTLDGEVYDKIQIRQGATVIFSQSNVFVNKIQTWDGATIESEGCANIYLNDRFMLAKNGTINANGNRVAFYVNNDVHIEKGSNVTAIIQSTGSLKAHGNNEISSNPEPTYMTGLFIAPDVHGINNVIWNTADLCEPCPTVDTGMNRVANFDVVSWPNPSETIFNLRLRTDDIFTDANISVYDLRGQLIHSATINPGQEFNFGAELQGGIYLVRVSQGKNTKIVKLIKR